MKKLVYLTIILLTTIYYSCENNKVEQKGIELNQNEITFSNAIKIAEKNISTDIINSIKNTRIRGGDSLELDLKNSYTFKDKKNNASLFHILNYKNPKNQKGAGFKLVSADRRLIPVLASSEEGQFEIKEMNPGLQLWINMVSDQLTKAKSKLDKPNNEIEYLWREYENKKAKIGSYPGACPANIYTNTGYFINTTWGQQYNYDLYSPYSSNCVNCNKSAVGCGPVAIAQVWNFHSKPSSASSNYGNAAQSLNFTYPLSNNVNTSGCANYSSASSSDRMVALLLREAGYKANTIYDFSGICTSLTWRNNIKSAFSSTGYSNSGYRISFNTNQTVIKNELLAGKPMIIDGNTSFNFQDWHIWIIDGFESYIYYTRDSNNNCILNNYLKYHLNWGWYGINNGWFYMGGFYDTNGYNYDYDLNVTLGMRP